MIAIKTATEAIINSQAVFKKSNQMEQLHDKFKKDMQIFRIELMLTQEFHKKELLNYYEKKTYIKNMAFTIIAILVLVLLIIMFFSQPSKMNTIYV